MLYSQDLLKMRWFQHKDQNNFKLEIHDQLELDDNLNLVLLKVNDEFLYLAFCQDDKLLLPDEEHLALAKLLNKLENNSNLKSLNGFIEWTKYCDNYNYTFDKPLKELNFGSTNSIFSFNHNSLLKLVRRLEEGEHPEAKLLFFLNDFESTPKILSVFNWFVNGQKLVFGLQIEKIEHKENAWTWLVQRFNEIQQNSSQTLINSTESSFEAIGATLALFHNCIFDQSSFEKQQLLKASDFTELDLKDLENKIQALNHKYTITEFLETQKQKLGFLGIKFKQHGDFHLGQILRTASGYKIIDLEGQPIKSLAERWQTASPAQDIASLIRSIQYAAAICLQKSHAQTTSLAENLENSFLLAYKHIACFPLPEPLEPMLKIQTLLKALEELEYEQKTRPEMAWIPEKAIENLLKQT